MSAPEAHAEGAVRRAADSPFLGLAAARRLCIDLIASEQERLQRSRRISPRQRIEVLLSGCAPGTEDDIEIGEDALGFDSLMLLDLVSVISRFFSLADSGALTGASREWPPRFLGYGAPPKRYPFPTTRPANWRFQSDDCSSS